MNPKKQQARDLYAQTDLTKTQIAAAVGISRRTLGTWVIQHNWDRLQQAANHLPAILAENCYHIMGHLTEHYLSENRFTNPVSHQEADTLYKLACTINKMGRRTALNESMEIIHGFLEYLRQNNQKLALRLAPYVNQYLASRAAIYTTTLMPETFTGLGGRIPPPTPAQLQEQQQENTYNQREQYFSDPDIISLYKEHNLPMPTNIYGPLPPFGSTRKKE